MYYSAPRTSNCNLCVKRYDCTHGDVNVPTTPHPALGLALRWPKAADANGGGVEELFLDKKGRPLDIKVFPHAVDADELANIRELNQEAQLHERDFPQRLESFVEADPHVTA